MKREAGVLQDRVEPGAVGRRRKLPQKRVRREQDEQQEADPDHRLHREHARPQRRRQVAAESATAAPNSARMNTHRSIEPSWLLHTPLIL